ncbi:unnamed protein product [Dibothriocephalus latus]|uniref:Uncharacterized protein n=1 Tax=Dibothriocephalus latus TaxID=60516 RepID=A0A3P7L5J7_DIBLA|nr:unnamed protein product [Dibothriocephalus latus]
MKRYHQFLVSLTDSSSVYNLVRPNFWIVQRLFEELLSDLMKALRGQTAEGPYSPRVLAIVSPYVFMLVDETCNRSVPMNSEYRAELLESMSRVFFEVFLLWDADCEREDLIAVALHFLLSWTAHGRFDNNGAGAQACARLHHAICAFSPEANYERIAFLTFRLDAMIRASCRSAFDFDPQKLVAMGCVALLERYKDVLELEKLAPNFPKQMSNFVVQFRTYVNEHSDEWETGFIERVSQSQGP